MIDTTRELMDINKIVEEICKEGTIWSEIIDNILQPNNHLKNELLSEVCLYYLENKEKIESVWAEGYFKYYFINTIKNQIRSNTSSFHKNIRINKFETIDGEIEVEYDEDKDGIEYKIELENKLKKINNTLKKIKISWFERQMYIEYYVNNKTYRQIEEEYDLDHVLVWKTVTKVIKQVKEHINKNKNC